MCVRTLYKLVGKKPSRVGQGAPGCSQFCSCLCGLMTKVLQFCTGATAADRVSMIKQADAPCYTCPCLDGDGRGLALHGASAFMISNTLSAKPGRIWLQYSRTVGGLSAASLVVVAPLCMYPFCTTSIFGCMIFCKHQHRCIHCGLSKSQGGCA